jgi:lipopolysaccharide/colanic/teichoic acid biosynthesis glycosyltransferase
MTTDCRNIVTPEDAQSASDLQTPPRTTFYRSSGKRLIDVMVVLLSTPFVVPLVVLLAILVAASGGRPFYTQPRIGRNGKIYKIWKLRSMLPDADARLEEYLASNAAAREEWDRLQKLKVDPRITSFGRFLRKSSLDELPQLWNVLIGEMSLVGPRPMMCNQKSLYHGQAYYLLQPGITGYWQVSDRNESSFSDRAEFDTRYATDVSLRIDTSILLATFRVVLRGTGY